MKGDCEEYHPFARVNLGHVLTILSMIGCFWLFSNTLSITLENRLTKLETKIEWLQNALEVLQARNK